MKMLKTYRLIALVAVIAMLASTATCFAFFSADSGVRNVAVSEATGAKDSTVVSFVGSEFELRAAAVDSAFNSPKRFSNAAGRKIITLVNDIDLTTNLMVTADCAINLGGYNINLNGHEVIFRNGYSGVFEIIGEGEFAGPGKVTVDLAHMEIASLDSYMGDDVVLNASGSDETSMAAIIFNFVGQRILGGEERGYFYDAIDLPLHYQSFEDITLTYHSSNQSALNDAGVVPAGSGINSVVTVTLDVTFEDTGNTYSDSWDVHVISRDQTQAWAEATFNIICDQLSMYKGETSNTYYFGDNMVLPGDIDYPVKPSSVSYAVYNDVGGSMGSTLLSEVGPSAAGGGYLLKPFSGGHQYMLNANVNVQSRTAWLCVYSSLTGYAPCGQIKIRMLSDTDAANATKEILKAGLGEDYENQYLEIELLSQVGENYTYTEYELVTGGSFTVNGETITTDKVEYVFEEENPPYEVVESEGRLILRVKESEWGNLDSETPDCFLRASFSYGTGSGPKVGTEYICVHYNPRMENDFYPYYKQLDYSLKQIKTDNSYTYQSFKMPAKINGKKPYVQYEIRDVDTGATNYVSLDHEYVSSYDLSLEEYLFEINPKALTTENKTFRIYYWYSFNGQDWSRYNTSGSAKNARRAELENDHGTLTPAEEAEVALTEDDYYYTDITIMGIVSDSSNNRAVPDNQLFNAMYHEYGGTTCAALEGGEIRVIPSDNLRIQKDVLDIKALKQAGVVTGNVANLTGIGLLEYTKKISLRNCLAGNVNLSPLSSMENLEELDLGNDLILTSNNFSSANVLTSMDSLFRDSDGDGWSEMKNLKVLNLENNMIREFHYLDQFPALEEVYVNGQFVETNTGFFGFIINPIYRTLYGSNGALNKGVFGRTIAGGTAVYNQYQNGAYSYSSGESVDAYVKGSRVLSGMMYQSTTANPLFSPSGGYSTAQRTTYLVQTVYGKRQSVSWPGGLFGWGTSSTNVEVPSSYGFQPLESTGRNTPLRIQITETRIANGFNYNIQLSQMLRNEQVIVNEYDWVDILDFKINVIYEPFEEIGYTETAPTRMLMMAPMMLDAEEMNGMDEGVGTEEAYIQEDTGGQANDVYRVSGDTE